MPACLRNDYTLPVWKGIFQWKLFFTESGDILNSTLHINQALGKCLHLATYSLFHQGGIQRVNPSSLDADAREQRYQTAWVAVTGTLHCKLHSVTAFSNTKTWTFTEAADVQNYRNQAREGDSWHQVSTS